MRKEAYRKSKDSPLELVSYKFFIIPKEVHNMANRLKIGSAMTKVDWSLIMQDAYALRDLGKVAHVQPYLLDARSLCTLRSWESGSCSTIRAG